jgi:hypothetical protein
MSCWHLLDRGKESHQTQLWTSRDSMRSGKPKSKRETKQGKGTSRPAAGLQEDRGCEMMETSEETV